MARVNEASALRNRRASDVGDGSFASDPRAATLRQMSAMPPIATEAVRRNELSRGANSGREQMQQNVCAELTRSRRRPSFA
jgi:hypothetical protein